MALDGNIPCALNAANEVTVQAFLEDRISFLDIARINEVVMHAVPTVIDPTLEDYIATDLESRARATELVSN